MKLGIIPPVTKSIGWLNLLPTRLKWLNLLFALISIILEEPQSGNSEQLFYFTIVCSLKLQAPLCRIFVISKSVKLFW